jgi:hypothetical protein
MVTKRVSWYKRLIELPGGVPTLCELQRQQGRPTAGTSKSIIERDS